MLEYLFYYIEITVCEIHIIKCLIIKYILKLAK